MNLLAIDTATEACSVALLHGTETDSLFEVCPQQQSQQILPMIDTLLSKHGLAMSNIDAIAYGRGPGSFTGVRIATSTVQGLALGANVPVVEISTLAAMAQEAFEKYGSNVILSLIDARMKEVYCGFFTIVNGLATPQLPELVCPPNEVQDHIKDESVDAVTGTGMDAYLEHFSYLKEQHEVRVLYPNALYMLSLAKDAIKNDLGVKVEDIKPVYLRDTVTWKKLPHKM